VIWILGCVCVVGFICASARCPWIYIYPLPLLWWHYVLKEVCLPWVLQHESSLIIHAFPPPVWFLTSSELCGPKLGPGGSKVRLLVLIVG
jgi:hypothetical protein